MALNYVYQVNDYFRTLVDESDATFMSDAIVTSYLESGYEQFRQAVSDVMPEFYVVSKDYTLSNATEVDLSTVVGPILGSSVAAPQRRLSQLIRVVMLDSSTNQPKNIFSAAASYEAMITPGPIYPARYFLQGSVLKFSGTVTGIIRIEYIPVHNVDWSKLTSATNEWIDDLTPWHDLIALFAASTYGVPDNAVSQAVQLQLGRRLKELEGFVTRGRSINANRFVQVEDPWMLNGV